MRVVEIVELKTAMIYSTCCLQAGGMYDHVYYNIGWKYPV